MGRLSNNRSEQFSANLAAGLSATAAYIKAGYSKNGAAQGAERLLRNVEVQARVKELSAEVTAGVVQTAINSRDARLRLYEEMQRRLWTIVIERSADPTLQGIPGGKSGFIVRQIKAIGAGAAQKIVPEYVADVGLSREIRALAEQEAKDSGDWSEKRELTGKNGGPIELAEVDAKQLLADRIARVASRKRPGSDPGGTQSATG